MIHVLGAGNIGALVATTLAQAGHRVSFIFKNSAALQRFAQADRIARIHSPFLGSTIYENQFTAEAAEQPEPSISKLIITTKTGQSRVALQKIAHRISNEAEILLLQNGMGTYEQLVTMLPPSVKWALGVTSAGVKAAGSPFTYAYTGTGSIVASEKDRFKSKIIKALVNSPALLPTEKISWPEFRIKQYEKLVVNAAINPYTAILECPNGALLHLDRSKQLERTVNESCRIIRSWTEQYDSSNSELVNTIIDSRRMLSVVYSVCKETSSNISSMLSDTEEGRPTEVDQINGYLVRLAKEADVYAPLNATLTNLVHMKTEQARHDLNKVFVPLLNQNIDDSKISR